MAGIVLVLAVLILGGVIATIGDRLGTKVGKARLSLFGMRPRKTAVAITILTGGVISATTLGILFATSSQLRTGLFELESIQTKLKRARRELEDTEMERQRIERERDLALRKQVDARKRLDAATQDLDAATQDLTEAVTRQQQTQARLDTAAQRSSRLRAEAERLQREQQVLMRQRDEVARQIVLRNQDIAQQNQDIAQRDREIVQRDRDIAEQESLLSRQKSQLSEQNLKLAQRDQEISQRDEEISEREEQISERDQRIARQQEIVASGERRVETLERTQDFLDQEIQLREQELFQLRSGNVALSRLQVLATRVVRVLVPEATEQVILPILQDANRTAVEALLPGTEEEQILQITRSQVARLSEQIQDGQEYVVQILSAGNFIRGEDSIRVFASVVPNEVIFSQGELIAATSIELSEDVEFSEENARSFQERLGLLVEKSRFRARQAGMVCSQTVVADDRVANIVRFYEQLQTYQGTLMMQAIASVPAYTVGPLRIDIAATRDGVEQFRTTVEDVGESLDGADPLEKELELERARDRGQQVVSYRASCRE